ncbi:hypothetical protein BH23CHL8_BH23CHL8_32000 [soil metagenome]
MCTTIAEKVPISGSGRGAQGWFPLGQVYVGYDHPVHAPLDHALTLDFVNEDIGPGARVAVELTRDAARDLAGRLLAALERADAHEAG